MRHPHGFIPAAQHALFDAGRLDLTDEALQRLQAAAKYCSVAQARTRQPTTEVLVCAIGLGMRREKRVELRLVSLWVVVLVEVWVEMGMGMGEPQVPRPGCACTRCQHLRSITVAIRGRHNTIPERSEVLSDRELPLHGGMVQRGAADLLLPSTHAGRMRPIRQL